MTNMTREEALVNAYEYEFRSLLNLTYDLYENNPSPEHTVWDDIKFPANGARLDSSSGRLDYSFDECAIDFNSSARYPNEPICFVVQLTHSYKEGSVIYPHIHWKQESDNEPNVMMEYRWYNNGEAAPAWKTSIMTAGVFDYLEGGMQIGRLDIDPAEAVGKRISSIMDIKIYRDSGNGSGLFAGNDSYPDGWLMKEFDVHIEIDSAGSNTELEK